GDDCSDSDEEIDETNEKQHVAPQRWSGIYDRPRADDKKGSIMLLVTRFAATAGEKRRVAIDPTRRPQVVDPSSTTKVKPNRFAGVDRGSFPGMSSREAADHFISSGASATTATITRDYQRENSAMRKGRRRHFVTWVAKIASKTVGYMWARRSFGGFAGSTFALRRARTYFNAIEWIKWDYSSAKKTIDTVEGFKEEYEHILELHESGVLEPLYMSVGIMFVVAAPTLRQRLSPSPAESVSSSAVSTPRDECAVTSDEEGGSSESELAKQLIVVADRLAALEIKSSRPPLPPPAAPPPTRPAPSPSTGWGGNLGGDSGANYDQMMSQLLERLDRREEIVQADSQAATAGTLPRAQEVTARDPEVEAPVRGLGDPFKDMRVMAKEKLEAFSPTVSRAIPGGSKTRVAPAMVARLYRNGATAVPTICEIIRLEQLEGNHAAEEML
ncbi:unnamed protein product, partial [Prorocentrum cordatum]